MKISRITTRSAAGAMVVAIALLVTGFLVWRFSTADPAQPIKVGILHSLSGTMAISETSVAEATLMAIDEINAEGGVLGRRIEPILIDGRSDWPTFAMEAESLITNHKVNVIFGCWTSASRRMVRPIVEKHNKLLFYPVQYEGMEESDNVVYTGAAPNQQIIPAVKWFFDNRGKRFFLVGSDYVFPWAANAVIKDYVAYLGGEIVGEEYLRLGSSEVADLIEKIVAVQPDVILNTINGDSNVAFFEALRAAGIGSDVLPTVSFSIAEEELSRMDPKVVAGDYGVWNYFQSIDTEENRKFVNGFKARYGHDRVVDDAIQAGYVGVYLWAQAVKAAGTDDVDAVRSALRGQRFGAPAETVYVDSENLHTWKTTRIGQIRPDGQFDTVWASETIIHPVPYPVFRTKLEWNRFLESLYKKWGGHWENPGE